MLLTDDRGKGMSPNKKLMCTLTLGLLCSLSSVLPRMLHMIIFLITGAKYKSSNYWCCFITLVLYYYYTIITSLKYIPGNVDMSVHILTG